MFVQYISRSRRAPRNFCKMSSKEENFLDANNSILENKFKFVRNELEENLEQMFGESSGRNIEEDPNCKIVRPTPGMCIKCFKTNTNEKFFINLCQTDGIPPPEDISEEDLAAILNSDTPSSFRIPMSISEPRITTDKSGNQVDICDIAINPKFFKKCELVLFRYFLLGIILEALSDKYNVQLNAQNWIVLKNRKFMGTLITHRIQNRDVKTVYDSYQKPANEDKIMLEKLNEHLHGKKLVQEINPAELSSLKAKKATAEKSTAMKPEQIKEAISLANSKIPENRIIGRTKNSTVEELIAEFYLPDCLSASEINVDIGEDRISLESIKRGYLFDKFVEYVIDQSKVTAHFNQATKMLKIAMPVIPETSQK